MPLEDLRTHSEWAETIKRGKQRIQCTTAGPGPTHQPWSHLPIGLCRSSSVSPESPRTNGVIAGRMQPQLFIRSQLKRVRPSFLSLCLMLKSSSVPRFNHPKVLSSHSPRGVSLPWKEIGMPGGRQGRRNRVRGRVGSLLCS